MDTFLSDSEQLFYGVTSTPVYFGLWATSLPSINFNTSENGKKQVLRRLSTSDSRFNNEGNTPKSTGGETKLVPEAKLFDSRSFAEQPISFIKDEQSRNRASKENFIKPLNELRAKRKESRAATHKNQPFPEIPLGKMSSENLGRSSEKVKRRSSESVTSLVVIDLSENKRKSCGLEDSSSNSKRLQEKVIKTEGEMECEKDFPKERSKTCESSNQLYLETTRNLEQELNAANFMLPEDNFERFLHIDSINEVLIKYRYI